MPFEWEHPPMRTGIEYRTVERYNGKPVYVKAVNCGMLVGDKSVEHGVANMKACIEVNGCAGPQNLVGNASTGSITVDSSVIKTVVYGDIPHEDSIVIIKYTKTTD